METWSELHGRLRGSTKERLAAIEDVQVMLSQGQNMSEEQLHEFIDCAVELLPDHNAKVQQGALGVLNTLLTQATKPMQPYVNVLVPLVVERLGDTRQAVRQEACGLLISMLDTMPVAQVLERMSRFWSHKAWKVRHGLLQTMAEAVSMQTAGLLGSPNLCNHVITASVNLLEDRDELVREAAQDCLQEFYKALGGQLLDNLQQQSIRSAVMRELITKLDEVSPTNLCMPETSGGAPVAVGQNTAQAPSQVDAPVTAPRSSAAGTGNTVFRSSSKKHAPGSSTVAAATAVSDGGAGHVAAVVTSDKELLAEMSGMVPPLSGLTVDWQQRIAHMQRLQALALGCPSHLHDTLLDGLRQLKEPLTKQVEDRRSAVSKQACQLLSNLSSLLGIKFQELLLYFFPTVAKVLPITVQVMADAADACCQALVSNCPSSKVVPMLATHATKDKNAKIRSCCASYLALALETWEPSVCQRCCDEFEAAMQAACQDASGATRAAARRIFAAYRAALPEQARQFSNRLPSTLLDKLQAAAGAPSRPTSSRSGLPSNRASFISRQSSTSSSGIGNNDPDIIIMAPGHTFTATSTNLSSSGQLAVPAAQPSPGTHGRPAGRVAATPGPDAPVGQGLMPPLPGGIDRRPAGGNRKSMAAPGRVLRTGEAAQEPAGSDSTIKAVAGPVRAYRTAVQSTAAITSSMAQRTPVVSAHAAMSGPATLVALDASSQASVAGALHDAAGCEMTYAADAYVSQTRSKVGSAASSVGGAPMSCMPGTAHSSSGGSRESDGIVVAAARPSSAPSGDQQQAPSRLSSISRLVTALLTGQNLWRDKVTLLTALSDALGQGAEGEQLETACCREVEKVVHKLLECCDEAHAKVAVCALNCLADCVAVCPHVLEPYLERALTPMFACTQNQKDVVRAAAARLLTDACQTYSADLLLLGLLRALDSHKQPRTKQAVLEFGAQHIGAGTQAGVPTQQLLRQWLRQVSSLVGDKHPDVRRCACDAIQAAYERVDAACVQAYIRHTSGIEAAALRKLLPDMEGSATPAPISTSSSQHALNGSTHVSLNKSMVLHSTAISGSASRAAANITAAAAASKGTSGAHMQGTLQMHSSAPLSSVHQSATQNDVAGSQASSLQDLSNSWGSLGSARGPSCTAATGIYNDSSVQGSAKGKMHQRVYMAEDYASPAKGLCGSSALASDAVAQAQLAPAMLADGAYAVVGCTGRPSTGARSTTHLLPPASSNVSGTGTVAAMQARATAGSMAVPLAATHAVLSSTPTLSIPSDVAGQTRLLNLLLVRLAGTMPWEPLQQLKDVCLTQVLPGAWVNVAQQLVTTLCRQAFAGNEVDMRTRELGLALVQGLATTQPIVLNTVNILQRLLPGLMNCAATSASEVTKLAFEALDAVLDVVPLPASLDCLTQQLESATTRTHHDAGSYKRHQHQQPQTGMLLHALCTGMQKVLSRMSGDQLSAHMPSGLLQQLRWCSDDEVLEVRKAAIYALAQVSLTLGPQKFEVYLSELNLCQQQLVAWATHKIREAAQQ